MGVLQSKHVPIEHSVVNTPELVTNNTNNTVVQEDNIVADTYVRSACKRRITDILQDNDVKPKRPKVNIELDLARTKLILEENQNKMDKLNVKILNNIKKLKEYESIDESGRSNMRHLQNELAQE